MGLLVLGYVVLVSVYFKFAHEIDGRLANGELSASTGLYAAPRSVAVGDVLNPEQLVERLRRSGYSSSRKRYQA